MKSQVLHPQVRLKGKACKTKVFVGMSGGVDSSVSAALLSKSDFDVTGVFIKVWQPDWIECTWKEERIEAMRAAAHLGIPFVTIDLEKEYKKDVVDYMISEYKDGRTPNPDVMCNKSVKFGAFYDWAMKNGADYVATGHYARIAEDKGNREKGKEGKIGGGRTPYFAEAKGTLMQSSKGKEDEGMQLQKGVDNNKDQSYFLWNIRTEQLPHILFPIGHLEKPEVRKLAKKFKLPNAEKKDSQGICFIGQVDMKEFLSHYIETKEGSVLNEKGEVIGTHPGALLFTIGERHGFTVTKKTPNDAPYFVTAKDVVKNTITVREQGTNGDSRLKIDEDSGNKTVVINQTNWIGYPPAGGPKVGDRIQARTRYRQTLDEVIVRKINGSTATIEFTKPQETVTPGQSLVLYDGERCVGGGIIE